MFQFDSPIKEQSSIPLANFADDSKYVDACPEPVANLQEEDAEEETIFAPETMFIAPAPSPPVRNYEAPI